MSDADLKRRLKGIRVPERADEYWENFPAQVRSNLRRAASRPELNENYFPRFAFRLGASFACFALALLVLNEPLLKAASTAIYQKEKTVHQQLVALPRHLRVFMADEHGLHYLVAEIE